MTSLPLVRIEMVTDGRESEVTTFGLQAGTVRGGVAPRRELTVTGPAKRQAWDSWAWAERVSQSHAGNERSSGLAASSSQTITGSATVADLGGIVSSLPLRCQPCWSTCR